MKYFISTSIFVLSLLIFSCSDQTTGADDPDSFDAKGTLKVSGSVETEHEGVSWYVGLQMGEGGSYANYSMLISDVPPGEQQENTYGFSIRMVGSDGPFNLTTGEYKIGEEDNGILIIASYTNKEGTDTLNYSTSPDALGTVTIHSISDTFVEAGFDVRLEAGPTTDSGFVTITGNLIAECITAESGGISC